MEEKILAPNFHWKEKEFVYSPKTKSWFIWSGAITLALLVVSIALKNYFLFFLLIVAGFSFFVHALKKPQNYSFAITAEGFYINNKPIYFKDIVSFWIFKKPYPHPPEISLILKSKLNNGLFIPINKEVDIEALRDFLKTHLVEKEQQESLIDLFLERIGF